MYFVWISKFEAVTAPHGTAESLDGESGMYDIFGDRVLEGFYKFVLCLKIFGEKSISSSHCRSQLEVSEMATTSIQASNLFNVNGLVAVITGGGSGAAYKLNGI